MRLMLLIAAILPAAYFLLKVYRMDRIEKEPRGLLIRLLIGGALSAIPAAILEMLAMNLLAMVLPQGTVLFLLIQNFVGVALIEELCKRAPVTLLAWKNPAFNYRFDAVVYCVFSALGFAALENVLYVAQSGLGTAIARAVLSVPGHCFFAVYMGLYLGQAKQDERDGEGYALDHHKRLSLLVPILLHGFWDFSLSVNDWRMVIAFYVFVFIFFLNANKKLRNASDTDRRIN